MKLDGGRQGGAANAIQCESEGECGKMDVTGPASPEWTERGDMEDEVEVGCGGFGSICGCPVV
jgi:hypothetical protein